MSINKDEFTSFLEDFLLEEEAKELAVKITGEEEKDAPMIDSMQKANYFLKLVKNIDKDIADMEALCAEELAKTAARIDAFRESQVGPLVRQKEYFCRLLKNFTEAQLADSKKRSIKLPNGTLAISRQQPLWAYEDEELIDWLLKHDGDNFITTKIENKINKVDFKKAVEINDDGVALLQGKEIPGLTVTAREDKFTVK